jgi:hypothetical protein
MWWDDRDRQCLTDATLALAFPKTLIHAVLNFVGRWQIGSADYASMAAMDVVADATGDYWQTVHGKDNGAW